MIATRTFSDTFAGRLIRWQKHHGRHDLPWQDTCDPYAIWVSEIMLQQTQVSTVISYYQRFMLRFPDVESLASATLDDVLVHWSGLGYYSRARNLHQASRLIMGQGGGIFPRGVEMIGKLPGVGRSTAAAIAVFAYAERCAILDGNVKRIIARYYAMEDYPGTKRTEMQLWQKAEELLPSLPETNQSLADPGIKTYTQALMDLGATICTPRKPKCSLCPLQSDCVAYRENMVYRLPAPRRRKALPEKETTMLLLVKQDMILLEKRPAAGIWGGLWSLPEMPMTENVSHYCARRFGIRVIPRGKMRSLNHTFTHFRLHIYPQLGEVDATWPSEFPAGETGNEDIYTWTRLADAPDAAIPAPVRKLLMISTPLDRSTVGDSVTTGKRDE